MNFGAMGVMAGAMFWLHSRSIERFDQLQQRALDAFKEQMEAERAHCHDDHERIIAAIESRSAAVMAAIHDAIRRSN